jgi:circadian clock protein KaiB
VTSGEWQWQIEINERRAAYGGRTRAAALATRQPPRATLLTLMAKEKLIKRRNLQAALEEAAADRATERYVLRLYIAGLTPRSTQAIQNIRKICEEHLEGRYDLEIIDLYQQPVLAEGEQIIAAPTLVKKLPLPLRRFIGDMSNTERILVGMDLRTAKEKRAAAERNAEQP